MVMSQSAFAAEVSKVYTRCFASVCDVTYYIKDGDSLDAPIKITRNGLLEKIGGEGFFTTVEKGSKEYQETIKKLRDLDKNFDSEFGKFSM